MIIKSMAQKIVLFSLCLRVGTVVPRPTRHLVSTLTFTYCCLVRVAQGYGVWVTRPRVTACGRSGSHCPSMIRYPQRSVRTALPGRDHT